MLGAGLRSEKLGAIFTSITTMRMKDVCKRLQTYRPGAERRAVAKSLNPVVP
jgi:hypothetical protein